MQQHLRVDGDIFENAPRVDADIFYTDKERCVFKNIRIRVDGALVLVFIFLAIKKCFCDKIKFIPGGKHNHFSRDVCVKF